MTPSEKIDKFEQNLGKEKKPLTVMLNISAIWRWFKKWRKNKNEENFDSSHDNIDKSIDDAINRIR